MASSCTSHPVLLFNIAVIETSRGLLFFLETYFWLLVVLYSVSEPPLTVSPVKPRMRRFETSKVWLFHVPTFTVHYSFQGAEAGAYSFS